MSIQDAIAAELPFLRAEAEARMTSRAIVRRKGTGTTTDADGFEVPAWDVVDADCPGRLAGSPRGGSASRNVSVGSVEVTLAAREWHFPTSRPQLHDGDLIEITVGESAGLVLRVIEGSGQDQATARRVPVVEAQRPEEW